MTDAEKKPIEVAIKIDPIDLLKAQDTDAMKWAKAFCQTLKDNPSIEIDEGLMVGWFANPIMCMHDKLYNTKIKQLEARVEKLRSALEFYANTCSVPGFQDPYKIARAALKEDEEQL